MHMHFPMPGFQGSLERAPLEEGPGSGPGPVPGLGPSPGPGPVPSLGLARTDSKTNK